MIYLWLLCVCCVLFVWSSSFLWNACLFCMFSIWLMQCLLCDLCGAYGFLKAFYQICVFVFCLILCVLEQSLNNVFVVHVWLQILLHVLFEECFLVALFCWLFRLKAFQNANRMDFVHLWMVYFGLLRWSTRKCKHTDCGEAGFLLKTSQNNPWFLLNLRVSEFSWVKPEMLQCASGPCPLTSWVGSTGETELDMSDIANVWNWIWMGWNRWWLWNQDLAAPLRWPMQAMQGEFASHCLLGFGKVQFRQFFARTWNFFDCWIYGLATAILPWSLQASECEHQMSAIWHGLINAWPIMDSCHGPCRRPSVPPLNLDAAKFLGCEKKSAFALRRGAVFTGPGWWRVMLQAPLSDSKHSPPDSHDVWKWRPSQANWSWSWPLKYALQMKCI